MCLVWNVALYAVDVDVTTDRRLQAFEMWIWREKNGKDELA